MLDEKNEISYHIIQKFNFALKKKNFLILFFSKINN